MRLRCTFVLAACFLGGAAPLAGAQTGFSLDAYQEFLEANENLTGTEMVDAFGPTDVFYQGRADDLTWSHHAFLEQIITAYDVTAAERQLLERNYFGVFERLEFDHLTEALVDVYARDLPVFISTDLVLHALHLSYDAILMHTEEYALFGTLLELLAGLYAAYPELVAAYEGDPRLDAALDDVDLYLTVAGSLLSDASWTPQRISVEARDAILEKIRREQADCLPLFSDTPRDIDFSQFTVRGHYTETPTLQKYFQAMMWLGRIGFWLTPPDIDPPQSFEDIRRMMQGAVMLNELVDRGGVRDRLEELDRFITLLVGESDNLTPSELSTVLESQQIGSAADLMDDTKLLAVQTELLASINYGQQILSSILLQDPSEPISTELPITFLLMGQRFIIDSHVFSRVVFPNILFRNQRIWRGLPDPLDALYVLGNDTALPLLQTQLDTYHYGSQLTALRYLVDAYDEDFWDASLYNCWLQALRTLNPPESSQGLPFFMRTAAWQAQKLNTQLFSWAQLRHDNLLYAKPSYTGGITCAYPHSYVEPYPEFYCQIARFAEKAHEIYAESDHASWIGHYFWKLANHVRRLEVLAEKERDRDAFTAEEADWLKRMLYEEDICGSAYQGWVFGLFFDGEEMASEADHVVADIHTQPTDEFGCPVGKVLHVGVGKIHLGVFLAESPSSGFAPMAYVGPVLSYHETITEDFERLTDEDWQSLVTQHQLPNRPDWANIYLADRSGQAYAEGRELPSRIYDPMTPILDPDDPDPESPSEPVIRGWGLTGAYPNPFRRWTAIAYRLAREAPVVLEVCDASGRIVDTLIDDVRPAGVHTAVWNAGGVPSGRYFCRLRIGQRRQTADLLLIH